MTAATPSIEPNLNLAVVGNCQVSALLDAIGSIVWMCLPRPDGDPVFSALLSRSGGQGSRGVFAVELADQTHATQQYQRNTAIVETTLHASHGAAVRITDFCPRFRARGRMFRPMMLVRKIEPLSGRPAVRLTLRPTRDYGAHTEQGAMGSHHLRFSAAGVDYRITTDASLTALMEQRVLLLEQPLVFLIGPDETIEENPAILARSLLEETQIYWADWVRSLAVPFEWQCEVIRAAITLKLCTFEDSGAVLAALTTSIPESPGSSRNWDYRYCWLRDSYFVVQAMNRLGATRTMEAYLHFIDRIASSTTEAELQPLYGLSGEPHLPERIVDTLEGYRGMGPVRVGNQAAAQTQNDVYGSLILAASQLFFDERLSKRGDIHLFQQLERLGERAAAVYALPDAGPWEFRGKMQVHTFSAAMSWAGCDRLARIAAKLDLAEVSEKWRVRSQAMRQEILARSWNSRLRAFASTFDGDDIDASVLLLPELGLIDASDARFHTTVRVVGKSLSEGPLLYRYRHADDFGAPETTFTICAFWYINALAAIGDVAEARERFCALLLHCNPLGLLSEDIDPRHGELWGNFPQTYSLVGLINSALRLSQSWEAAL